MNDLTEYEKVKIYDIVCGLSPRELDIFEQAIKERREKMNNENRGMLVQ